MIGLRNRMASLGYRLVQTGGGCTAYEKTTADGIVFVTRVDDPTAPESLSDAVCVGLYASHEDLATGEGLLHRCENLQEAIDTILPVPFGWYKNTIGRHDS